MSEYLLSKYDMFHFICDNLTKDTNPNRFLIDGTELLDISTDKLLYDFKLEYVYSTCDRYTFDTYVNIEDGIHVGEVVDFIKTLLDGGWYFMYDDKTKHVLKPDEVVTVPSPEYINWCCYKLDGDNFSEGELRVPYICYFKPPDTCNGSYSSPWVDLFRYCYGNNKEMYRRGVGNFLTNAVDYWSNSKKRYYRFIIPEKLTIDELFSRIEEEAVKRHIAFSMVE